MKRRRLLIGRLKDWRIWLGKDAEKTILGYSLTPGYILADACGLCGLTECLTQPHTHTQISMRVLLLCCLLRLLQQPPNGPSCLWTRSIEATVYFKPTI